MFWFRKAAEQGLARAQYNLGVMYDEGQGVPKNVEAALLWYRLAAEQSKDDEVRALAQKNVQGLLDSIAKAKAVEAQQSSTAGYGASGYVVPMEQEGGTYVVPGINSAITLDFTVDSGAADVSIPEDVFITLIRAKTVREEDFIGNQVYVLGDGSRVKSIRFRIRSLQVGGRVLENVTGSVGGKNSSLLLGQSFLGRFKSWLIDNSRHALVLE
jgi:predicted aspartyl protease